MNGPTKFNLGLTKPCQETRFLLCLLSNIHTSKKRKIKAIYICTWLLQIYLSFCLHWVLRLSSTRLNLSSRLGRADSRGRSDSRGGRKCQSDSRGGEKDQSNSRGGRKAGMTPTHSSEECIWSANTNLIYLCQNKIDLLMFFPKLTRK